MNIAFNKFQPANDGHHTLAAENSMKLVAALGSSENSLIASPGTICRSHDVSELIGDGAAVLDPEVGSKDETLEELAGIAAPIIGIDYAKVLEILCARESIVSTAIGMGAAIPQARFRELRRTIAVFLRLAQPVDFNSGDEQPVDLVLALFGPEPADAIHLDALMLASRSLRQPGIADFLRRAQTLEAVQATFDMCGAGAIRRFY